MHKHIIALHPMDERGLCRAILMRRSKRGYVSTNIQAENERAVYALLDVKREAIVGGLWQEKCADASDNRSNKARRRRI